jgi:hypothetical protein
MEGDPSRIVCEHQARRDHELRKIVRKYPNLLMSLKIDTRLLQKLYRFRCEHVFAGPAISNPIGGCYNSQREGISYLLYAKMKIELPGRHILWVVAVFVGKGESNLDDLEQVHVTAHGLIVVVRRCLEAAYWTRDDTRKLGVLDGCMGVVRLVRGACVPRGGHTNETNG